MTLPQTAAVRESTLLEQLSDSDRHRLLADERRRQVLDVYEDETPPMSLRDLARNVAKRSPGTTVDDVEQISVELHHQHLPMLDELDSFEYDSSMNQIR